MFHKDPHFTAKQRSSDGKQGRRLVRWKVVMIIGAHGCTSSRKRENHSLLLTKLLCSFNKNSSIFNLYSEDYAMIFYIWLFSFCTLTPTNLKKLKHCLICIFVLFIYLCCLHNFKQGPQVQPAPGPRKPQLWPWWQSKSPAGTAGCRRDDFEVRNQPCVAWYVVLEIHMETIVR